MHSGIRQLYVSSSSVLTPTDQVDFQENAMQYKQEKIATNLIKSLRAGSFDALKIMDKCSCLDMKVTRVLRAVLLDQQHFEVKTSLSLS